MPSPIPARARDELRALVKLALPLALAQAGQALMGLVDTAVVFTLCILGIGTLMGVDPLISQALGAGDGRRAGLAVPAALQAGDRPAGRPFLSPAVRS